MISADAIRMALEYRRWPKDTIEPFIAMAVREIEVRSRNRGEDAEILIGMIEKIEADRRRSAHLKSKEYRRQMSERAAKIRAAKRYARDHGRPTRFAA